MGNEIDPVEFGRLLQSVETLTAKVDALTYKVAALESRITAGKGMFAGILIAAGGIGAGAKHLLESLSK